MICISCKNENQGNYCNNCGEKLAVSEITMRSILNSGINTLVNMDKGFLYNGKQLFLNPQKLVFGYINGRRKGVFNPVSYFIVSITIFLIVESLFKNKEHVALDTSDKSIFFKAGHFMRDYFKYFWIFSTTLLSLATKLIYNKYRYVEHLTINSFVMGQATLIGLFTLLFFNVGLLFNPFIYLTMTWLIYKIYKNKHNTTISLIKATASIVLFVFHLFLFGVLIILSLAVADAI